MDMDDHSKSDVKVEARKLEHKYTGFTSYAEAVQNGTFNSFHVLGNYRQLQQEEQNAMMKEYDTSDNTCKQQGMGEIYLQCFSLKYRLVDEVGTKIMVVHEVINSVMKLIKAIEQSITRVKLTKWRNKNPKVWLCLHIRNGAKMVSEYIDGFRYGSGVSRNVPGKAQYICFQLSLLTEIDLWEFLYELNSQLPEIHHSNQAHKAYSNCKDDVVMGALMRSYY